MKYYPVTKKMFRRIFNVMGITDPLKIGYKEKYSDSTFLKKNVYVLSRRLMRVLKDNAKGHWRLFLDGKVVLLICTFQYFKFSGECVFFYKNMKVQKSHFHSINVHYTFNLYGSHM